ncbi:EDSAP-1 family PEP-CTERM protein [Methylomonas sp. 2BW1-5-20]|uniref:EDSAP-1 family PEP-CTERM protein n=1 Tax=Methylomonas sp. 2BW1-5-20 TaxID=3376686 RepID=UPI0040507FED
MKTKQLAAIIGSILAGSLVASSAQAVPVASAESVVTLQNFKISYASTGVQVDKGDFDILTPSSTEKVQASVNATSNAPAQLDVGDASNLASSASVGTIVPANISTEILNNSAATPSIFTVTPLPIIGGNFAASGSNEVGSPITGFPAATASSATLYNASYASLDATTGTAGTSTNSGLTAKFSFSGIDGALNFTFDVGAYIGAYLTSGAGVNAKSAYTITFALEDLAGNSQIILAGGGTGTFSLGKNLSDSTPGAGTVLENSIAGYNPVTGALITTALGFQTLALDHLKTYNLTATITTDANVKLETVPEPQVLALLGIGLLGMGLSSRKFPNSSSLVA